MFTDSQEIIDFDYCIITAGCNFGPFKPKGESLWFPTVHEIGRSVSEWPQFDERFIEGRRRHIFHEYAAIDKLRKEETPILVVGAGFIGVEWVTELQHFFKGLSLQLTDILPAPLGPLPLKAKAYCQRYMSKVGINQFYQHRIDWQAAGGPTLYKITDPKKKTEEKQEWLSVNIKNPSALKQYICIGVKASNYFMPESTLSAKGPGGGGWILMDKTLAVKDRDNNVWCKDEQGYPRIFAVGDCNYGCITPISDNEQMAGGNPGAPSEWPIPPIPKISYPGEEEGVIAAKNVEKIDHLFYGNNAEDCFGTKREIHGMHWPWGAGMFATSLGPHDACFVVSANWTPNSGFTVLYGSISAVQKEFIEHSKVDECAHGFLGRAIWHFVHHTPLHLWGGAPRWGY